MANGFAPRHHNGLVGGIRNLLAIFSTPLHQCQFLEVNLALQHWKTSNVVA